MSGRLRVAIVGAGPAGAYAASHLLRSGRAVEVEVLDRLPTPWGLIRSGVAPDHQATKGVTRMFDWLAAAPGFRFRLGVDVGRDVTIGELRALHHAVIVAVGAAGSRRLGLAGEDLPGSLSATAFVGWYNGHPDAAGLAPDLSTERVVIVGNGNVALDVARILTTGPEDLARTDIADHALRALHSSAVREVVLLGRRGPQHAAFTTPELIGLEHLRGVDVVVEPAAALDAVGADLGAGPRGYATGRKLEVLRRLAARPSDGGRRRIVLRFNCAPTGIEGQERVTGVRVARTALVPADDGRATLEVGVDVERVATGLVLRSIGYRGVPMDGLPFDDARGVLPTSVGRVSGETGVYATGWIKRGPTGVIGTNRHCAAETVQALLEDRAAGRLAEPVGGAGQLTALLEARRVRALGMSGWQAVDAHERGAGAAAGRPRVKLVDPEELRVVAHAAAPVQPATPVEA